MCVLLIKSYSIAPTSSMHESLDKINFGQNKAEKNFFNSAPVLGGQSSSTACSSSFMCILPVS